jgi:hypothetical protein
VNQTPDHRTDAMGQCWDIHARLAFTADAIGKAYTIADKSAETLKVFPISGDDSKLTGGSDQGQSSSS